MASMLSDLKKRLRSSPPAAAAHEADPVPAALIDDDRDPDAAEVAEASPTPAFEPEDGEQTSDAAPDLDYSGNWWRPPLPEEVEGYLLSLHPDAPSEHDDVQVAEERGVFVTLEGGVIVPGACLVARGWIVDPENEIVGLYLVLGAKVRPIGRSAHVYRKDVNDYTRARPGYRAGFTAIAEVDAAYDEPQPAKVAALVHRGDVYSVLVSSRMLGVSRANHLQRVADELGAQFCTPREMARIAENFMSRISAVGRQFAWPDRRHEVIGAGECEVTMVVVIDRNIDVLGVLLAFLEMRPNHRRLGLVIVFRRPEYADKGVVIVRGLRQTSGFAFIKLLNPGHPVTFGAAAKQALELAEGDTVIVCTDEVLPPGSPWIERMMQLTREDQEAVLAPRIVSFDGRPELLAGLAEELPLNHFEWDHAGVAAQVDAEVRRRLDGLGAGVIVASREFLNRAGLFDDSFTQTHFAFADAFLRLRAERPDAVQPVDVAFTALTLPEHYMPPQSELLFNLYALASTIGSLPTVEGRGEPPPPPEGAEGL